MENAVSELVKCCCCVNIVVLLRESLVGETLNDFLGRVILVGKYS